MKKILLSATALSLLFAASCKKKDDNNGSAAGSWKLGSNTYGAVEAYATGGQFVAFDVNNGAAASSGHMVDLIFSTTPTANGTYKVVSGFPGAGEMQISAGDINITGTSYTSTGNDNISATVTVNNGKISVSIPNVWVKNDDISKTDSVQLSATLNQTM